MHEQEPSVSDILSSIRQILSDKIETDVNASKTPDMISVDAVPQSTQPLAVSDEEVFVLTSQMRVPEKNETVQNKQDMPKEFVASNTVNDKKTPYPVMQPVFDGQGMTYPAQEEGISDFGSDISPTQGIDIKPMVQAWLDKNLPQIVEKIVSEEVRRIFNKR